MNKVELLVAVKEVRTAVQNIVVMLGDEVVSVHSDYPKDSCLPIRTGIQVNDVRKIQKITGGEIVKSERLDVTDYPYRLEMEFDRVIFKSIHTAEEVGK